MPQNMPKWGIVLMAAVIAGWVGLWVPPAVADAPVERTGQTESFAAGDDGDIQAGHPLPTPRFKDEGDGTVEDKLTDLIWLKDASCLGSHKWEDTGPVFPALAAVADLNEGQDFGCVDYVAGTFDDWRLPNIKELQSLIHFGFFNPALSNALGTGQYTATDCAFSGVQSAFYWSSTTIASNPDGAWGVSLVVGLTFGGSKDSTVLLWPVRGGA